MASQVTLVLGTKVSALPASDPYFVKVRAGFEGALRWLEEHCVETLALLPTERRLSLFEVTLFCLLEHLEFRGVFKLSEHSHPNLLRFAEAFAARPSAQATVYRFDAAPQ